MVGESLVGGGNEVAHVDVRIGPKDGPIGEAFATALVNQKEGHTNLLAIVAPNLPCKPDTIMSNKVTIKGDKQATQMFGPAQGGRAGGRGLGARGRPLAGRRRRSLHHRGFCFGGERVPRVALLLQDLIDAWCAEDLAAAAVYLASSEGSYLTGQAINVGGGVVM